MWLWDNLRNTCGINSTVLQFTGTPIWWEEMGGDGGGGVGEGGGGGGGVMGRGWGVEY